jgi:hypothetical protein
VMIGALLDSFAGGTLAGNPGGVAHGRIMANDCGNVNRFYFYVDGAGPNVKDFYIARRKGVRT